MRGREWRGKRVRDKGKTEREWKRVKEQKETEEGKQLPTDLR